MIGSERGEALEAHSVGATIWFGGLGDGDLDPGNRPRHLVGKVADSVIPLVRARIHGEELAAVAGIAVDCPLECAGHVRNMDERTPRRPIAEDRDLPGRNRRRYEVVEDYV